MVRNLKKKNKSSSLKPSIQTHLNYDMMQMANWAWCKNYDM